MTRLPGQVARALLVATLCWVVPTSSDALEFGDGRVELHGFYQMEFRGIADSFELTDFNPHQWAHTLKLEAEFDLLPNGWGPISLLQAFVSVEGRFDCVWQSMCHIATGQRLWGNEANRAPSQFTNGRSTGFSGSLPDPARPSMPIHGSGARLVPLIDIPPLDELFRLGGDATRESTARTLAPTDGVLFAVRNIEGSVAPTAVPLGPWVPEDVKANGALRSISTTLPSGLTTPTVPLPMRPIQPSLYSPSPRLRELVDDLDDLDVNFSENELQWNRGASQQQVKELREAFLDLELFDGDVFVRVGRQTTVWGKTELFRAQDQFNPQDIALSTLPSLESSRIPLWSIRAIWSLWDVGPLSDVRIEFATNLDHFEPTDVGTCGEPYTVWVACLKKGGAFAHGVLGVGLAGEERPQDPWNSTRGIEAGVRIEFRYRRFSFALTDFYGFPDFGVLDTFNEYERNVDPTTGRPRLAGSIGVGNCTTGAEPACLTPDNAGMWSSGNRQLFDVLCSGTSGLLADGLAGPGVFDAECALDLFNTNDMVAGLSVKTVLARALGGAGLWNAAVGPLLVTALGGTPADFVPAVSLHRGLMDGPEIYSSLTASCGNTLSDQQEALLGTGAFFHPDLAGSGTDICAARGIDLYHTEASVLLEAFPQFDGPVARRFVESIGVFHLPGARGPDEAGYDPLIDGCVRDLVDDGGACDGMAALLDPRTGLGFRSEMTAVSYNFLALMAELSVTLPGNESCVPGVASTLGADQTALLQCSLVSSLFLLGGARRPEVSAGGDGRFGRRDFLWHGGSESRFLYKRRNVLGFATDFAEDRTKTSWGVEFVWFEDEPYANTHEKDGWSRHDTLSLTISMDRPTVVNFLNANTTIFINTQVFVRWIDDYTDKALTPDGPFSMLATITAFTGFWQDRLMVSLTMIHELESNSSGFMWSSTYRFTKDFSVSTGLTTFRGEPRSARMPVVPQALSSNEGNDYESRSRLNGLSPLADREELFVTFRYTF
ncbi:MAG: hypothetical protein JRH10_03430 [Deltaproteobacteria bacterium]|nr:hypothetical protein [Deltaproteobacteria bacterium]